MKMHMMKEGETKDGPDVYFGDSRYTRSEICRVVNGSSICDV